MQATREYLRDTARGVRATCCRFIHFEKGSSKQKACEHATLERVTRAQQLDFVQCSGITTGQPVHNLVVD